MLSAAMDATSARRWFCQATGRKRTGGGRKELLRIQACAVPSFLKPSTLFFKFIVDVNEVLLDLL
jgi:hypothetical protein